MARIRYPAARDRRTHRAPDRTGHPVPDPLSIQLPRATDGRRDRSPRNGSIVFGLLAWTKLADSDIDDASVALYTVVTTVLFSVVAYGLTAWWLGRVEKSSPTPRSSDLE